MEGERESSKLLEDDIAEVREKEIKMFDGWEWQEDLKGIKAD